MPIVAVDRSQSGCFAAQERWQVPGAEFIPGTGKGGTNEGGIKRYLAFSTGPRSLPSS